ncbi:MAG TPA: hypothetical protein VGD62_07825 [Acidobacteriaceae bacterium]
MRQGVSQVMERGWDRLRQGTLFLLGLAMLVGLGEAACGAQQAAGTLGIFSAQSDVGTILHGGAAQYDPATRRYLVSGSGDNTWFRADDLYYVWKRVDGGDLRLAADIAFPRAGGNAHRKAMLMVRQSLDAGSAYVDVAWHGDGLTSLQYRNETGDVTREVRTTASAPARVAITRRGDFFYVSVAGKGGALENSGAAMKLPMHGPFYVGLAVCSHDKDVVEQAAFSNVEWTELHSAAAGAGTLVSTLETVPIASTDRSVVYTTSAHFEAPNWLHDNSGFLVNQDGHLERIPAGGGAPQTIDTASAKRCNNDHGLSPDGNRVALSDGSLSGTSHVYTVPLAGGTPKLVTTEGPSYFHGWSPDGRTLAFTGQRAGEFDIYTIPTEGGTETRLTTAKGLDDGPEYTPDGAYIYFNSERTGHMQIWRMHADGSAQEQVTQDETNDWFPHISPDGKWMVFLAYGPEVTGHPAGKDVTLQLVSLVTGKKSLLAKLFGGQGTMNVASWSPDSTKVAFVSYQMTVDETAR